MNIIPLGSGKCSYFGGASDLGVSPQEGLSLIEPTDLNDWWFRRIFVTSPGVWDSGKGLARNLNPQASYCAMRWAYGSFEGIHGEILQGFTRDQIRRAIIVTEANGNRIFQQASDWGPNKNTDRLIDMSPGDCKRLGVQTDDVVTVSAIM